MNKYFKKILLAVLVLGLIGAGSFMCCSYNKLKSADSDIKNINEGIEAYNRLNAVKLRTSASGSQFSVSPLPGNCTILRKNKDLLFVFYDTDINKLPINTQIFKRADNSTYRFDTAKGWLPDQQLEQTSYKDVQLDTLSDEIIETITHKKDGSDTIYHVTCSSEYMRDTAITNFTDSSIRITNYNYRFIINEDGMLTGFISEKKGEDDSSAEKKKFTRKTELYIQNYTETECQLLFDRQSELPDAESILE